MFNNINKKGFSNIIIIIAVVVVAVIFGRYLLSRHDQDQDTQDASVSATAASYTEVFRTQQECEQKTGEACSFQMCDYIPPGKTFEEVCGEGFKKGWVPSSSKP